MKNEKKLTFVYEWIGPLGPISNSRIPNISDFAQRVTGNEIKPHGLEPIYYNLQEEYGEHRVICKTPCQVLGNEKFIYEFDLSHYRDWYGNFFIGKGILENTLVSESILKKVRKGQGHFLLITPMESFVDNHMFDLIHKYFKYHNIPLKQVIYCTNSPNSKDLYKIFCDNQNLIPELNCEYFGIWEKFLTYDTLHSEILLNNEYKVELKEKTFLNFNRRYREHRFLLILQILKLNLLDQFFISFDKMQPEGNDTFLQMATFYNREKDLNLTDEQINSLNDKLPLVLDTEDFSVFPMEKSLNDTLRFYKNSLIHVVSETEFFTNIIHVSEKTFKPIMYKQPFIFVGPPKILEFLKQSGYKTFDSIWDESYDLIENHDERMDKVVNLISELSMLSDKDKIKLCEKIKDIVDYNFNWFITKPATLDNFLENYGT